MRFGFVAGSLAAHAAVVCLAWQLAPIGERATPPRAPSSGLPSDSFEVTPWEPHVADAAERVAARTSNDEVPNKATASVDDTPLATVSPAREGAPPKKPSSDTRAATQAEPAQRANAAPSEPAAPRDERDEAPTERARDARKTDSTKAPGDWMSLDDQLPDPVESRATAQPTRPLPQRDALVERLLAKERDKARLAALEEAQRRENEQREDQRRASSTSAAAPSDQQPRAQEDDTFGDSHARADLWVELTRWLPRAASSDQAWESLPSNASYEFRVELVTEGGKLVDSRVLDAAPAPTNRLLTNTSHLMERGKFGGAKRVMHRFELRIRLSETEPRDLWIAHTTPDPPKPGVGSFIAPSGRRFDVWVSKLD